MATSGFERLVAKRRRPPPPSFNGRNYIPGFGPISGKQGNNVGQVPRFGNHDGIPNPKGTGPFKKRRGGSTRNTPGSVYGRRTPTPN